MNYNKIVDGFKNYILSKGITPPNNIIADGKIHRFHVQGDKPSTKNGWYVVFTDHLSCGVFGTWKEGITYNWSSKPNNLIEQKERNFFHKQLSEAKKLREQERRKEQKIAAEQAKDFWNHTTIANPNHPYLLKKQVQPFYAHQQGENLVLPIIDIKGNFHSLQYISSTGDKWFLSNGAIRGYFIPVQHQLSVKKRVLISEGFATGATLAQQNPSDCVIAACNAGNLKPLATSIRNSLPDRELIICVDDDRLSHDNPGLTKGREAAIAAGALLSKPVWPVSAPTSLKDFNDLYCWLNRQEVRDV